jgi:hypothetical protein
MKVTKLGHKSRRKMKVKDVYHEGAVLMLDGELYLVPNDSPSADIRFRDEERLVGSVVLINLSDGNIELIDDDFECGLVRDAQIGYYEDDVEEWIE